MVDKTEINLPDTDGVSVPDGYTLISNKFVDYYFFVPSTWSPAVNTGMSAAYLSSDKSVTANVVAFNTTYMNLDDYWVSYETDLTATFGEVKYLNESKFTASTLSGIEARCYSYEITQSGVTYRYDQHLVIYGGYVYIVTFSAESSAFSSFGADFDGMLANFKFKNA